MLLPFSNCASSLLNCWTVVTSVVAPLLISAMMISPARSRSGPRPVSYTHLDVYKRQSLESLSRQTRRNSLRKCLLL